MSRETDQPIEIDSIGWFVSLFSAILAENEDVSKGAAHEVSGESGTLVTAYIAVRVYW